MIWQQAALRRLLVCSLTLACSLAALGGEARATAAGHPLPAPCPNGDPLSCHVARTRAKWLGRSYLLGGARAEAPEDFGGVASNGRAADSNDMEAGVEADVEADGGIDESREIVDRDDVELRPGFDTGDESESNTGTDGSANREPDDDGLPFDEDAPQGASATGGGGQDEGEGPLGGLERDEILADGLLHGDTTGSRHVIELTRHVGRWSDDLWLNAADGTSLGFLRRAYWRQLWRQHYVYFDHDGHVLAEGTQPLFSPGVIWRKQQTLRVYNGAGEKTAEVKGLFWTWAAVKFVVKDGHGKRVADVWVDRRSQSVVFTAPGRPNCRLAALLREQQAGTGYDRWRAMLDGPDVLDFSSWAIIEAFFINFAEPSRPLRPAGG